MQLATQTPLRAAIPFPGKPRQHPNRPAPRATAPFSFATDLNVIRAEMAMNEEDMARERVTLAWAIARPQNETLLRQCRASIARYEAVLRAGRARLFELESRAADAVLVGAALVVDRALAPTFGEQRWAAE